MLNIAARRIFMVKNDKNEDIKLDTIDAHVGMRIRQRRNLLGLTQGDIAEKLNIRYQQVQKYERGQNRVAASTLFQLSKILQIPVNFFFDEYESTSHLETPVGFAEDKQATFEGDDPMLKRETMNLVRAYYNIKDEKQRKRVYELIRSLASEEQE